MENYKFVPSGKRLLVRSKKLESTRKNAFVVGNEVAITKQGVVESVGVESAYKVGDIVIFNSGAGRNLHILSDDLLLFGDAEILGTLISTK